ncbi:MAG: type II secretion system major pseudopilin GspG [Nitrospira sp.]|nr:type II secretion system protein GspG [Candidatus Manganitrophaceae bacterium]HIL35384.1 type II secretion system protein GspG [Candidatus Manganitrophaceae bacterium]
MESIEINRSRGGGADRFSTKVFRGKHASSRNLFRLRCGVASSFERGFTLIEIMVVVTILAILAALVVPKLVGRSDDARRVAAKVQIKNIEGALQLYKLDSGIYPSTSQGLDALVEKPNIGRIPNNWKEGGYLPKVPKDPWGKQYAYLSPGRHGDYDLVSYGPDGEQGGEGKNSDIESWDLQ